MVGIILVPQKIYAIIASSKLVSASGAIHVRIVPTWTFLQVVVLFVLVIVVFVVVVVSDSVLVQLHLYLGSQFLDCGGEFGVGACELADGFGQQFDGLVLYRRYHFQIFK